MNHIVCLSGGLDSSTLLGDVCHNKLTGVIGEEAAITAVSFRYPSNHNELELKAASSVASFFNVDHHILDMSDIFKMFSSDLLGGKIPEGHYTDDSMKSTVVPMRNLIFLTTLAGWALSRFKKEIIIHAGVHAGDHPIYPDCRPDTMDGLRTALYKGSDLEIILSTPYIDLSKGEIVRIGLEIGVPYQITRTCYTSETAACGRCGSCVERLEAFEKNNIEDPITYQ